MIVLFSAIGPQAQEQLDIGIGALAGSTIMLLTIPWFLSVLGGRVNVVAGKAVYKAPKLEPPESMSFTKTGVALAPSVNFGAALMIISSVSYLIIEIPALIDMNLPSTKSIGIAEKTYALLSFIACLACFIGYLYYQWLQSLSPENLQAQLEAIRNGIEKKNISIIGVINSELQIDYSKKGFNSFHLSFENKFF